MEFSVIPGRIQRNGSSRWKVFFTVILSRMAADFRNVYRYNVCLCLSVVSADVLEHNCNPAGKIELSFVVGTCVFVLLA